MNNKPLCAFITGVPGVGKTTIRENLPKKIKILNESGIVYLDKDVINRSFANDDRESEFYKKHIRVQSFEALIDLAGVNLEAGNNVLIDTPFIKPFINLDKFDTLRLISKIVILGCIAPDNVIYNRVLERNADRDNEKLGQREKYRNEVPILEEVELHPEILKFTIDTSSSIDTIINNVINGLKNIK